MRLQLREVFMQDEDNEVDTQQRHRSSVELQTGAMSPTALIQKVDEMLEQSLAIENRDFQSQDKEGAFTLFTGETQQSIQNLPVEKTTKTNRQSEKIYGSVGASTAQSLADYSSGVRHSELTKYQSVKTSGPAKGYVKYTQEQIELAQKLRHLEAKQNKKKGNMGDAKMTQTLLNKEAKKRRDLEKLIKLQQQMSQSEGMSFNIRGSLPQIKYELEKRNKPQQPPPTIRQKIYHEDQTMSQHEREYQNNMNYSQIIINSQSQLESMNSSAAAKQSIKTSKVNTRSQGSAKTIIEKKNKWTNDQYQNDPIVQLRAQGTQIQNFSSYPSEGPSPNPNGAERTSTVFSITDAQKAGKAPSGWNQTPNPISQGTNRTPSLGITQPAEKPNLAINKLGGSPSHTLTDRLQPSEREKKDEEIKEVHILEEPTKKEMIVVTEKQKTPVNDSATVTQSGLQDLTNDYTPGMRIDSQGGEGTQRRTDASDLLQQMSRTGDNNSKSPGTAEHYSSYNQKRLTITGQDRTLRPTGGRVSIYSSQQTGFTQPTLKESASSKESVVPALQIKQASPQKREKVKKKSNRNSNKTSSRLSSKKDQVKVVKQKTEDKKQQLIEGLNLTNILADAQQSSVPSAKQVSPSRNNLNKDGDYTFNSGIQGLSLVGQGTLVREQSSKEPKSGSMVAISPQDNVVQFNKTAEQFHMPVINPKSMLSMKKVDSKAKKEFEDRGYHSSSEPQMDQISSELYNQIIQDHLIRRGCWIPSRFKKFPRFTIFTQKDEMQDKGHLISQFISLNPQVLALLAASDINNLNQINSVLEEPAVTNRSNNGPALQQGQSPRLQKKKNISTLDNPKEKSKVEGKSSVVSENEMGDGSRSAKNGLAALAAAALEGQSKNNEGIISPIGDNEIMRLSSLNFSGSNLNSQTFKQNDLKFHSQEPTETQLQQFDPFDKVLLTKGIDNQILTSFRTLSKSNNMISNTLKVVHQRFQPTGVNKQVSTKVPKSKVLYHLNKEIYDPVQQQKEFELMTEEEQREYLRDFAIAYQLEVPFATSQEMKIIHETQETDLNANQSIPSKISKEDRTFETAEDDQRVGDSQSMHKVYHLDSKALSKGRNTSSKFNPKSPKKKVLPVEKNTRSRAAAEVGKNEPLAIRGTNSTIPSGIKIFKSKSPLSIEESNKELKNVYQDASLKSGSFLKHNDTLQKYNADLVHFEASNTSLPLESNEPKDVKIAKQLLVSGDTALPGDQSGNLSARIPLDQLKSREVISRQMDDAYQIIPPRDAPGVINEQDQGLTTLQVHADKVSNHGAHQDSQVLQKRQSTDSQRENLQISTQYGSQKGERARHEIIQKPLGKIKGSTARSELVSQNETVRKNKKPHEKSGAGIEIKLRSNIVTAVGGTTKPTNMGEENSRPGFNDFQLNLGAGPTASTIDRDQPNRPTESDEQLIHNLRHLSSNENAPVGDDAAAQEGSRSPKKAYGGSRHHSVQINSGPQNTKQNSVLPAKRLSNKFGAGFHNPKSKKFSETAKSGSERDQSPKLYEGVSENQMTTILKILTAQSQGASLPEMQRVLAALNQDQRERSQGPDKVTGATPSIESDKTGKAPLGSQNQQERHLINRMKRLVDEVYQKERKYAKRQIIREDMVHTGNLIFDLSKARNIDNNELQNNTVVNSESRHAQFSPEWQQPPPQIAQAILNGNPAVVNTNPTVQVAVASTETQSSMLQSKYQAPLPPRQQMSLVVEHQDEQLYKSTRRAKGNDTSDLDNQHHQSYSVEKREVLLEAPSHMYQTSNRRSPIFNNSKKLTGFQTKPATGASAHRNLGTGGSPLSSLRDKGGNFIGEFIVGMQIQVTNNGSRDDRDKSQN